jgi:hypothetical protein
MPGYLLAAAMVAHAAASPAPAALAPATWYIRADGGSAEQCDGRHDAPYAGGNGKRDCAWRHPFEALPPGGKARIGGGDTLVIGAGSYMMGRGAPGTESLEKCRKDWPWDCHAGAVPAGPSADRATRILGAGYDSGCSKAPELWGTQRASEVIDLEGSSNVEIACLEITDHSGCIEFHNAQKSDRCERDAEPYGSWAPAGIAAADSANVRLRDLNIHGLAHDGIRAGRLRDWTLERVRIVGNGWAGWNGDVGGDGSANNGHMVFRDVEIAWNGCLEAYPSGRHSGCWGQENGGYGDGLGTAATGGDWLFDHVNVHHNTQDGIDLLHALAEATIAFRNVHAEANAGNQLKASGSVTIEDSTVVGSCAELSREGGLGSDDACRARGNSISLSLAANTRSRVSDNVIEGEGDCLVAIECQASGCRGAAAVVSGNRMNGAPNGKPGGAQRSPCSVWIDPQFHEADLAFSHNQIQGTRNAGCPEGFTQCDDNRASRREKTAHAQR